MIVKRQKAYSGRGTQFLFRLKKAANQVGTAVNNAGLKTGDKITQTLTGKTPVNPSFKFHPKSDMQLKRETISTANTVNQAKNAVTLDPGGTVGKVVNETVVQPAKHAPIGTIASQFSPIPGTGLAYVKKGAPVEAKMWDTIGVGRATRPVRRFMDTYVTDDRMVGAGRGVVSGLKIALA